MTATIRFCPTCRADVEDVGGHCLLGHSLRLTAPTAPISSLRADIESVFEEAEVAVAAVAAGPETSAVVERTPRPVQPVGPPAPPAPPPPPASIHPSSFVNQPASVASDPIAAFAPAPTMDWGPDKPRFLRRRNK